MQDEYSSSQRVRKSSVPFDALFAEISRRTDITPHAKLVYAKLTTMHRLNASWSQEEIGEKVGLSRQGVWRALQHLSRADLVVVTRYGLGRSNGYALKGIDADDIDGRANNIASRVKRIRAARLNQLFELYGKLCLRCGSESDLEIDHVIPRALGGPDDFTNLQLLCKACNSAKGSTTADYRLSPGIASPT